MSVGRRGLRSAGRARATPAIHFSPRPSHTRAIWIYSPWLALRAAFKRRGRGRRRDAGRLAADRRPRRQVLARQQAVQDWLRAIRFRENLFTLGQTVRLGVDPKQVAAWGAASAAHPPGRAGRTTALGAALDRQHDRLGSVRMGLTAGVVTLLNFAWAYACIGVWRTRPRRWRSHRGPDAAGRRGGADRAGEFFFAQIQQLQAGLEPRGCPVRAPFAVWPASSSTSPAAQYDAQVPDLVLFWSAQLVFAAERWRGSSGRDRRLAAAVASWKPFRRWPVMPTSIRTMFFRSFPPRGRCSSRPDGASLLARRPAVRNSVKLARGLQLMILSGPNMAAKAPSSAAWALRPCWPRPVRPCARRGSGFRRSRSRPPLHSGLLAGGISRFYAEIPPGQLVSTWPRAAAGALSARRAAV